MSNVNVNYTKIGTISNIKYNTWGRTLTAYRNQADSIAIQFCKEGEENTTPVAPFSTIEDAKEFAEQLLMMCAGVETLIIFKKELRKELEVIKKENFNNALIL